MHGKTRWQNILLLVSSYIFYGWWDWRFLFLIFFSTCIDFVVGILLPKEEDQIKRKLWLWLSIISNLGILVGFKYFNFFIENFTSAFSIFGYHLDSWSLSIILPVGISFYTFQTLSYTIDVYKKTIKPTENFISFAAYVSFFPQLVAGPIERAGNLLPQFDAVRKFDYHTATEGLKQILWGLFKKVVIADNCAEYVNLAFENPHEHSSSVLVLGAILFAIQIYCDFSGYSDMAIGTAKLFGFSLMQNFAYPYFSRDIAEFWRRWHISLSTWFRDYVYVPLGGSRVRKLLKVRNILIVFLLSGFWHGANWTFIFWGLLNALYFLPISLTGKNRQHLSNVENQNFLPSLSQFVLILKTFILTVLAWIFFRSESMSHAVLYLSEMWSLEIFSVPRLDTLLSTKLLLMFILLMFGVEWYAKNKEFGLSLFASSRSPIIRWAFYSFLILCMGMYMRTEEVPFIYFQF